jgi:hypothetical protein
LRFLRERRDLRQRPLFTYTRARARTHTHTHIQEFEYPFYENVLLDALNAVEEGPGLLAVTNLSNVLYSDFI